MIFSILGILIFLMFYSSYFIKMVLQRRQGIKTDQLGRGTKQTRIKMIEIVLKISTYSMAGVQVISIAMNNNLQLLISSVLIRYIGVLIGLIGIIIFVIAMVTMQNNWRAGIDLSKKTNLITHGIYKYSRNPAFLGFHLFYIGFTLMFCNLLQLLLLLICICTLHIQILEEEKHLILTFSKEYANYKKATPRYFRIF